MAWQAYGVESMSTPTLPVGKPSNMWVPGPALSPPLALLRTPLLEEAASLSCVCRGPDQRPCPDVPSGCQAATRTASGPPLWWVRPLLSPEGASPGPAV